jgi:hypothetical protein
VTQVMGGEKHVFKRILHSPTSTNHNLNVRSPLGNDELQFWSRGRSSGSCNAGV